MSHGINYLHSHSGIERTLKDKDIANKSHVLIDEEYKDCFVDCSFALKPFGYNDKKYYKVPTLTFVSKGGVFKNLFE